ncbi:S9 family peptidase [Virgibacillus sp. NKC19-3]|uniref:S9 family peptidase n=1 Tax=Virgibacillus saliphilus TaxID=2831674 RepID=UPI001C9AA5DA|nr:S9 family peptidase [Virgibacillus sp. NKC19-3]MBY7142983.1 S9 family peptidase [Virgibacillus sp. NKC19-3]
MSDSKRAITTADITQIDVFSDPKFTPDGDAFTYVSTTINDNNDYESHLFFQHLNEDVAKQWTFGDGKNSNPSISPDGKKVVFQSNRSGLMQLWMLYTDGGEARQLTTFKNGAGNPNWSKDGRYIIFSASLDADDDVQRQTEPSKEERQKEKETQKKQPLVIKRLDHKSDANGFHDTKRAQLILFDTENDTITQLTTEDADHTYQDISPDGNTILFAANLNEDADYENTNDLYLFHRSTKTITKLTDGQGVYHSASFSPNGDKIACFGHEYTHAGATQNELYIFDVETNRRTCLSEAWDMQLGDVMIGDMRLGNSTTGPIWSKDETRIFFIASDFGATGLYQVTVDGDLNVRYKKDNHVFGFSYDAESETFILGISTPTNPCNFYQLKNDDELKRLTNANATFLDEVAIVEPEALTATAEDGWEIQGWLLRPYGFEEGKKYPFILEIHGGPHMMYGRSFFHEMQLLAAKGYVVLYTNPRGSYGYGQAYVDAVRSDYGGGDYTDLMSAVDYALENYSFIDDTRLGVTGGSYGGFMTNWIVGHTNRFKAAVTQRSISNWLSFYGVSDIGYFFTKWELGKNIMEDPEQLWNFSPLKYAENVETPLLILHSEQDYRCPIEQGEQLFTTLKHLRKNVEFVRFPDASHELSRSGKPEMRMERLNHICRWFETYL